LSFDADDLLQRVRSLEGRADKSDRRLDKDEEDLADHERRIKALEAMDLSTAAPISVSGEIDTTSILKMLNMVKIEQSSMRTDFNSYKPQVGQDLEALRLEMRNHTNKEVEECQNMLNTKMDKMGEKL